MLIEIAIILWLNHRHQKKHHPKEASPIDVNLTIRQPEQYTIDFITGEITPTERYRG